jgi:hypothetical protein
LSFARRAFNKIRGTRPAKPEFALDWSDRESRAKVQSGSLLHFGSNVYSQRGDDGIIREIFRRLGVDRGFFIEFGAWDGIHLANTRLLFENGWGGMFIEGDAEKVKVLKERYRATPDVICLHGFVYPSPGAGRKTLDDFCDEHAIKEIDFLSIDIDGLDLNIFESLRRRPTVVAIEGGYAWHPQMTVRVPDEVAAQNLQQPLEVVVQAVKQKGYEPICLNQNLYIVDSSMASKFEDIRHDAVSLWLDAYYDQSESFRSHLSTLRATHALIRQYEAPHESKFTIKL